MRHQEEPTTAKPYGHLQELFALLGEHASTIKNTYIVRKTDVKNIINSHLYAGPTKKVLIDSSNEGQRGSLVSTVLDKLPAQLLLSEIIGCVEIVAYNNVRYIQKGNAASVIHSGEDLVLMDMEKIADRWMFVPAHLKQSKVNSSKYDICMAGYMHEVPHDLRLLYDNYILLKQVGIASYLKRDLITEGDPEAIITQFITKLQNDMPSFAEVYIERHAGSVDPTIWIVDAFSDYFAGYFMGTIFSPEKKFPLCFQSMHEPLEKFIFAKRAVAANN